jgi:hypothetical protein
MGDELIPPDAVSRVALALSHPSDELEPFYYIARLVMFPAQHRSDYSEEPAAPHTLSALDRTALTS